MNRRTILGLPGILTLSLALGVGCTTRENHAKPTDAPMLVDFNSMPSGGAPAGFTSARTGGGAMGSWQIAQDGAANRVLAQVSTDDTDNRYPVCVFDGFSARDVKVSCRFKTIDGQVDQAAGLVARIADENNYYVVRANALEGNVRLYHVVNGVRTQFAGETCTVSPREWHELSLEARGSHFEVGFDDKSLFTADNTTISNAGRVGLWTKADSVTWFDDLRFAELKP